MRFISSLLVAVTMAVVAHAEGPSSTSQSSPAAVDQYNLAAQYQKLGEYDLAAKEWQRLATNYADDPLAAAGLHYAGVCEFQQGNYPSAIASFEKFLATYPKNDLAEATLANLGLAAYNQAQRAEGPAATELYQQAANALGKLRTQFPDSKLAPQSEFYRGEALYALGKLDEAQRVYSDWLKKYEGDPLAASVRLALGSTQAERGDTRAAIATLQKLIDSQPSAELTAQAKVRLADALAAAGRHREAANAYQWSFENAPQAVDTEYVRRARATALFNAGDHAAAAQVYGELGDDASAGKALYQAGNYAAAAERLATAWQQSPNDADLAHWWVQSLLKADRAAEALATAEKVLATTQSPEVMPEVMFDRADALYAIDARRAESVAAYIAAAEAAGDSSAELAGEARYLAAATALELRDYDTAIRQAQRVVDSQTAAATDALATLAEAQLQSGDAAAAAGTFRRLLESAGDEEQVSYAVRLAWAESTAGDEQAVIEALAPLAADVSNPAGQQMAFLLGRAKLRTGDAAGAIEAVQPVAMREPPGEWSGEALLILGRAQLAAGQTEPAIQSLSKLLEREPKPAIAAQAYYRRAEAYEQTRQADAATEDYDQVVSNWPDSPLAPYAAYRAARSTSGKPKEAADRYRAMLEKYPGHQLADQARLGLATALVKLGDAKESLAVLDQLDQKNPRVALARGMSFAGLQDWDAAIAALESAASAEGEFADRPQALYELGWAYRQAGRPQDAEATFQQLARDYPDNSLAADAGFRVAEALYDEQEHQQAATAFRAAAAAARGDATLREKALHMVGWARHKAGDEQAALAAFEEQLAEYPSGPLAADAKWMKGEALFAGEKYAEALDAYKAAQGSEPAAESLMPLAMLHAGQAAGQLGQWQAARDWLQTTLQKHPEFDGRSEVEYELGWTQWKLGSADQARPLLEKVAQADKSPIGARARFVLGELEFADKDYEQAVRTFFQVAYGYGDRNAPEAYHPWQAESLFEAARCLEQLDRTSAANKLYEELLERFPNEPKADLARQRLEAATG